MTPLRQAVAAVIPGVLEDVAKLVAIPSVSSMPEHAGDVLASAHAVAEHLMDAGCPDVQIVTEGGAPAVIGRYPAPPGVPTVCLYAHHDVQPVGDVELWDTEPFTATVRGQRMYGRGAADDKGGIGVHLAVLRAFEGKPPVGVTVFVEGEEEIGSPSLVALIQAHQDTLRSDVFVIADSGNWDVGQPAFTTSLRGVADCVVEVATLDHAVHSGSFGGVVPDALTTLCRLIATLHDDAGNVAVAGLGSSSAADLVYPEARLRAESGILDGVAQLGTGSIVERAWAKPAISVIALDTTRIADASNTLLPTAKAKISLRVAPGGSAASALDALVAHLETNAPWGARVTVTRGSVGDPSEIRFSGPVAEAAREAFAEAWAKEPVFIGQGGSIPMVADFQRLFPDAAVFVTAVSDPDSRMHGPNESIHLGDFGAAALAEALLLQKLALVLVTA